MKVSPSTFEKQVTSTMSPLQRQHQSTIKSDSDVTTQEVPKLTPKNKEDTTLIKHNNQQAQDNTRSNQKDESKKNQPKHETH